MCVAVAVVDAEDDDGGPNRPPGAETHWRRLFGTFMGTCSLMTTESPTVWTISGGLIKVVRKSLSFRNGTSGSRASLIVPIW